MKYAKLLKVLPALHSRVYTWITTINRSNVTQRLTLLPEFRMITLFCKPNRFV